MQEGSDDEESVADMPSGAAAAPPRNRSMYAALRQDVHRTRRQVQRPQEWSAGGRHFAMAQMASHYNQRSAGNGYASRQCKSAPRQSKDQFPMPAPPSMGEPMAAAAAAPMPAGSDVQGRKGLFGFLKGRKSVQRQRIQSASPADCMQYSMAPPVAPSGAAGPSGGAFDLDDDEGEVYVASNMYANSCQRTLVEKTKDAVDK